MTLDKPGHILIEKLGNWSSQKIPFCAGFSSCCVMDQSVTCTTCYEYVGCESHPRTLTQIELYYPHTRFLLCFTIFYLFTLNSAQFSNTCHVWWGTGPKSRHREAQGLIGNKRSCWEKRENIGAAHWDRAGADWKLETHKARKKIKDFQNKRGKT